MARLRDLSFFCLLSILIHAAIGSTLSRWAAPPSPTVASPSFEVAVLEKKAPEPAAALPTNAHLGSTAAPSVEVSAKLSQAALSTTPVTAAAAPDATERYSALVRSRIEEHLRYPLALRRRGLTGQVGLRIIIDVQNGAGTPELSLTSGSTELDALALEAVRLATPFPAPGEELKKMGKLVLSLPIEFKVR